MKKIALITGGSRGIGFGIATELVRHGYDLAIMGMRKPAQVSDALESLNKSGRQILYCQGNVAVASDRDICLEQVRERFGQLNVLVNNAGIAPRARKDILETTEESFDEVMGVNLRGPYFLTQKVAGWMIEQKSSDPEFNSCIINVSSVSATVASVNRGEYCISKAGLSMMTKLFAVRLASHAIPVYEIQPGIILTDMTESVKQKYDKLIREGVTLQPRWGLPGDVGKAAVALVSGELPYSTGQVIMVDGGLTIQKM